MATERFWLRTTTGEPVVRKRKSSRRPFRRVMIWSLRSWPRSCPELYTAIVAGTNNTTGVGLVEVYNIQ